MLRRGVLIGLIAAALRPAVAGAQSLRLYMKDGSYHIVREYQVLADRVRYYSVERGDWEEVPLDMVDLKKTVAEVNAKAVREKDEAAAQEVEDKFERAQSSEVARVPAAPGVYYAAGERMDALKQAELKIVSSKKRTILRILTGIPIVPGKSTVEIDGEKAAYQVPGPRPQFYFRPAIPERLALARLRPAKGARLVEVWTVEPVTKTIVAERDEVEIFRQQLRDGLYKVWPVKDIEPGEYAWLEYTEGEGNPQVWDFRVTAR